MTKRPVIIDCDTGTDDAIAIIAALGCDELDVRAFTTVCGNADIGHTSANTLNLVHALGLDIPVARGAEGPLLRSLREFREAEERTLGRMPTHGRTGLGDVTLPQSGGRLYGKNAVETIYEQAVACGGELEIIALAPQTNLALALTAYPELKNGLIKRIYFMGGAVRGGNSTAVAEFNIFFDPEAAKIVLNSGIPLTMTGLDVTLKAKVPDETCEAIRSIGSPASKIVSDILDFMKMRRDRYHGEDTIMHDALAVAAACVPQALTTQAFYVDVECAGVYTYGHTYVQRTPRLSDCPPNCDVALEVDVPLFLQWRTDRVRSC
jgi:inosine-uridine nucleoside N-ribohydrolase